MNSDYGAISRKFTPEGLPLGQLTKHFTVVRVRVSEKEQLASTIDKITKLTGLSLGVWILCGHGNETTIAVNENSLLQCHDTAIMQQIGKRIPPFGQIILAGCLNGAKIEDVPPSADELSGEQTTTKPLNIAETFSSQVPEHLVFASPDLVTGMIPTAFKLPSVSVPTCVPYFQVSVVDLSTKVSAFMNGRKVAEGSLMEGIESTVKPLLLSQVNQ